MIRLDLPKVAKGNPEVDRGTICQSALLLAKILLGIKATSTHISRCKMGRRPRRTTLLLSMLEGKGSKVKFKDRDFMTFLWREAALE